MKALILQSSSSDARFWSELVSSEATSLRFLLSRCWSRCRWSYINYLSTWKLHHSRVYFAACSNELFILDLKHFGRRSLTWSSLSFTSRLFFFRLWFRAFNVFARGKTFYRIFRINTGGSKNRLLEFHFLSKCFRRKSKTSLQFLRPKISPDNSQPITTKTRIWFLFSSRYKQFYLFKSHLSKLLDIGDWHNARRGFLIAELVA